MGDNDMGIKQDDDKILDTFAPFLSRPVKCWFRKPFTQVTKKLSLTSDSNATLNARFNLWGNADRPTVIELDDDQSWHLDSQRNPDGSIIFTINGNIYANRKLNVGSLLSPTSAILTFRYGVADFFCGCNSG